MFTTKCPHCGGLIRPAAMLGKSNKGVPKRLTQAERDRRSARLAEARKLRWVQK